MTKPISVIFLWTIGLLPRLQSCR